MYRQFLPITVQFDYRDGVTANMKTFKGNMHDYIYESQAVALNVINQRKEITKPYINAFSKNINRIIITGAGTSNFSPQTARIFMEKITKIPTYVYLPIAIVDGECYLDENCVVIGISSTGSSACTIDALNYAKSKKATTIAFTNDKDSPFGKSNENIVYLDHGIEDCSPKSKSYICELVTLSLCAIELAYHNQTIDISKYEQIIQRLTETVNNLENITKKSDEWYQKHSDELKKCNRMLVVGYEANKGNIMEGALKILECGRFQTSAYELEEFMHGIYHSIDKDCYLVYVGNQSNKFNRMLKLKEYLDEYTSHQFIICNKNTDFHDDKSLDIDFKDDEDFYFIEYIVPLQILAYQIAVGRGINPNIPSDPLFHKKMNSKFI